MHIEKTLKNIEFNFYQGEALLINKEINWTSFDVVKKIKNLIKPIKTKVGHAGTLDPLASGLMIICIGKETKQINTYQNLAKEYEGSFILGAERASIDLETPIERSFAIDNITNSDINNIAKKFIGEIEQVPPEYSAIKVSGERAYNLARLGVPLNLKPREVHIYNFEILEISLPVVKFKINCSKGTYIRSIVRDFGKALNNGAYLNHLVRTKIGDFSIEDSMTIADFSEKIRNYR